MPSDVIFNFNGRRVLVIGASRAGIGRRLPRRFKAAGADVTITGIEPVPAEEDRGHFAYAQLDVRDGAALQQLADASATS